MVIFGNGIIGKNETNVFVVVFFKNCTNTTNFSFTFNFSAV